jgi:excisionase family DNA binding protein
LTVEHFSKQRGHGEMVKAKLREYVKVAEAAEILGVSQGTVRAWAEAGKIPMHKHPANGYRLFKRRELEDFLAAIDKPSPPTKPK